MASITITFFVCWTPSVVYSYVYDFHKHVLPERDSLTGVGYALALLVGLCSSLANPILYSLLNENFRKAVADIARPVLTSCLFLRAFRHYREGGGLRTMAGIENKEL